MFIPETENSMSPERLREMKQSFAKAISDSPKHRSPYPTIVEKEKAERFREKVQELNEQIIKTGK